MVLSVPSLPDRLAGLRLTAAIYKNDVTDAVTFLANRPLFIGRQNTPQSIADGGWAAITLDTESVDTYNGHSMSSNTSRYTAQVSGWYTVCGVVAWSAASTTGSRGARIAVNGTEFQGGASMGSAPSLGASIATPTRTIYLNASDYVELQGGQLSGASQSTNIGADACPALWVIWSHV